ncbi:hypothetical protein LJ707_01045 [Mucilaginibacter sp. UR6-1]|uniref:hypothetical protein n=1 Tax=Mucilaginibacter sp. UR6-1 TaxID=1435643 RepID=UPI001E2DA42D|nr:hypothetical protein [Mucilaginibacter sp. UR6-1]MCC8407496.1 hypothetical protein [Mucilaginibacter sp. UR6-1]
MSKFKLPFLLAGLFLCCSASGLKAQVYETPELHGDTVVFPLTLIDVYPFISGTVNSVGGKFMFDTGYQTFISLNDNFIELPDKKAKSSGVTGSGQSFKTNVNDTISEIRFGNGLIYRKLLNIPSANYDFLQKNITPDFIGFIGYDFFRGYLFKLDYLHRKVTFYKSTAERTRTRDFLKNEKVLAVIDFEIRKLANHPIIRLKIDGINVVGVFDTGQNGLLQLDATSAKLLESHGSVLRSGTDSYGDTLLNVKNIIVGGKLKTSLNGLALTELNATQIEREKSGITEPNLMNIGYRFLVKYKTVWDYAHKKIYVLEY